MKTQAIRLAFCFLLLFSSFLAAEDALSPSDIYEEIADIYHPTLDDYRLIQNYLTNGYRPITARLRDYEPNARNFKIIGETEDELPSSGLIAVNSEESERENCLVAYSSFNKNYPRGLARLVNFVAKSDFKGHILYRLGGWPNVEGGSLVLAHVPYAFKVSFLKEAQRLGYKRAFWLDTAVLPYVSLNTIFKMIEEKGYFVLGNSHMIGPYMDPQAAAALGVTMEEANHIPSCSAGIFGVDFTSEIGAKIVDLWYNAALDPNAFFSPRSDQNALSVILYQLGISDFISIDRMAHNKNQINANTLIVIEREFVNELSLQK
ncbi:hypothetical protein [Candidatus Protochlamydia phocaeensis]|uniref:hypothetical protein n=1 Tax=Candidatus Protochlamydia phocaeensis TaxID=1414722 RepID=UPI00083969D2|nr:hypothetical protein [Candidatus Protochlamydia phocaeensis]